MSLHGSHSILTKTAGRHLSGSTTAGAFVGGVRSNYNANGANRARYFGGIPKTSGIPNGYLPPYSWILPYKAGGMSVYFGVDGLGIVSNGNLAGGLNAVAGLTGVGTITNANGGLILSAVATLLGIGSLTGAIVGSLNASATLVGTGDLTGSIRALAHAIATINGTGTLTTADMRAIGKVSANIIIGEQGVLTPQGLANAVWEAVVSEHLNAGTTGKKLKDSLSRNEFIALK